MRASALEPNQSRALWRDRNPAPSPAHRSDLDIGQIENHAAPNPYRACVECVYELVNDCERAIKRDRSGEFLALDQLHHDRVLFETVDRRNVRIIQQRPDLRVALEPP